MYKVFEYVSCMYMFPTQLPNKFLGSLVIFMDFQLKYTPITQKLSAKSSQGVQYYHLSFVVR
jgi:hypothetical protein